MNFDHRGNLVRLRSTACSASAIPCRSGCGRPQPVCAARTSTYANRRSTQIRHGTHPPMIKQTLGWPRPKLRTPRQATLPVIAAHTQLRLVRQAATDLTPTRPRGSACRNGSPRHSGRASRPSSALGHLPVGPAPLLLFWRRSVDRRRAQAALVRVVAAMREARRPEIETRLLASLFDLPKSWTVFLQGRYTPAPCVTQSRSGHRNSDPRGDQDRWPFHP